LPWTDAATDARLTAADAAIRAQEAAYESARVLAARSASARADALLKSVADLKRFLQESVDTGLVAYYPFEETARIPADKLPRSRPQGRRLAPPKLAPATLGNV